MTRIRFLLCFISVLCVLNVAQAGDELLQQAQDNLTAGYYREAEQQLQQLSSTATQQHDTYTATLVQGLQGLLALQRQQYDTAEQSLNTALTQAKSHSWHDLIARFALYLGQLHQQQAQLKQAQHDFELAITEARTLSDKSLLISSLTHAAKLAVANQKIDDAWSQLQQAQALLTQLPVCAMSAQLWLNSGYQVLQLYTANPQQKTYLATAFYQLNKAADYAEQTQQKRTQAAALKHLATLYQQQARYDDAIKLSLTAIQLAQQDNAQDSLIDLEWQLGQLYKIEKQPEAAIAAYKRAIQHLEALRLDIPVSYEKGRSSFKSTFEPLYLGLADLLLQQAPLTNDKARQQVLLHEAQDALELMKKSELEDYFQSRCNLPATPLDLKKIDPHAAAIYPIQLPDRLEIIVYTADGLHQFTNPIAGNIIEEKARLFAAQLRKYSKFSKSQAQAEFLYHALIDPIQPLLKQQRIETLIYIPDGALRLLPLSALYDGKKFLIEDYAIVTSPGISLIASDKFEHTYPAILFAGMSTPGNVVRELPDALLGGLMENIEVKGEEKRQLNRYLQQWQETEQKRELNVSEQSEKTRALRELLDQPAVTEKLQEELALPGVGTEIKQLAEQNNMSYVLNEDFSLAHFMQLLDQEPHRSLHIASHGFFGATTDQGFIMTHDKILTMNKLEELLGSKHFKKFPLDLIVLSACQTAEGDDRSPLGISGIAIKAKVHSAVGSLWSVSDEATAQLMTNFYAALKKTHYSKAKALQAAEISLLKQKIFKNPSMWSPFVLVGNWW